MAYTFTPPSVVRHSGEKHPLWGRMRLNYGVSLLKKDGLYRQVEGPTAEETAEADIYYIGGHVYAIAYSEGVDLIDAGYGEFVAWQQFYGTEIYGLGPYGGYDD